MNLNLKTQKILFEQALDIQQSMKTNEGVFRSLDPAYYKQKKEELEAQYAETLAQITRHLTEITGCVVVEKDKIKSVIIETETV